MNSHFMKFLCFINHGCIGLYLVDKKIMGEKVLFDEFKGYPV